MRLFGSSTPKSGIGRYLKHIGLFGIAAALFGAVFAIGVGSDIKDALTMRSVEAEVVGVERACSLTWKEADTQKSKPAESCAAAEQAKEAATDRLYKVERTAQVTLSWAGTDGATSTKTLDAKASKPFSHLEAGETTDVRVGSGPDPKIAKKKSTQAFAINLGVLAFIAWVIWPPGKQSFGPGIYVRKANTGGGRMNKVKTAMREKIAGWAIMGAALGAAAALIGGYVAVSSYLSDRSEILTEAQVTEITELCQLVPGNAKLVDSIVAERIICEQAREIAKNRPEMAYKIKERFQYHLAYNHPTAGERNKVISKTFLFGHDPAVNDTVPVKVDPENPRRMSVTRHPDMDKQGIRTLDALLYGGLLLFIVCAVIAKLLGAIIIWPRFVWLRRMLGLRG